SSSSTSPLLCCEFSFAHPNLHSFPTRRSSDLESSSDARTWSPAAADNAAPATNRAANVTATAARRRRERGLVLSVAGTGATASSDRKSTRLNSSHEWISYAVFCLKKKKEQNTHFSQVVQPDLIRKPVLVIRAISRSFLDSS